MFYATVIGRSPGGSHGVDARPSDAVNLALVAGTAIRVDDELFDLAAPCEYAEELAAFPVATAAIAAETQQRQRDWDRP